MSFEQRDSLNKASTAEIGNVLSASVSNAEMYAFFKGAANRQVEARFLFCADEKEQKKEPAISSNAVEKWVTAMSNDKSVSAETLAAFKKAAEQMRKLDQDGLKKTLEEAMANKKVSMQSVVNHLREVCELGCGFDVKIGGKNDTTKEAQGGFILKHSKKETYVQIQWDKAKKEVTVLLEDKR